MPGQPRLEDVKLGFKVSRHLCLSAVDRQADVWSKAAAPLAAAVANRLSGGGGPSVALGRAGDASFYTSSHRGTTIICIRRLTARNGWKTWTLLLLMFVVFKCFHGDLTSLTLSTALLIIGDSKSLPMLILIISL